MASSLRGDNGHFPLYGQTRHEHHVTPGPHRPHSWPLVDWGHFREILLCSSKICTQREAGHRLCSKGNSIAAGVSGSPRRDSLALCTWPNSQADKRCWVSSVQQEKLWQCFLSQLLPQTRTKTRIIMSTAVVSELESKGRKASYLKCRFLGAHQAYQDNDLSGRNPGIWFLTKASMYRHVHHTLRFSQTLNSLTARKRLMSQPQNYLVLQRSAEKCVAWLLSSRKFQSAHSPWAGNMFNSYPSHDRSFVMGSLLTTCRLCTILSIKVQFLHLWSYS